VTAFVPEADGRRERRRRLLVTAFARAGGPGTKCAAVSRQGSRLRAVSVHRLRLSGCVDEP
jgi:hypothetical protein